MKKIAFILIIVTTFLAAYAMQNQGGTETLEDILQTNPDQITKISLSTPSETNYNITTDDAKINKFITKMKQLDYKKIRGNEPAYLPMEAGMIYFYENETIHFIVAFEDKVMINKTFYEITNGKITNEFLSEYYHSLK
ncbi:hypothetical protein [Virgibacillus doumboii]|uniref:hypothetical protein n=1 Tax=Virgibacillus doumboii TaxID=2697503 RepID=UPI0013DEBDC1|nr:hypothetical protein [Virgibacillus doumboii]